MECILSGLYREELVLHQLLCAVERTLYDVIVIICHMYRILTYYPYYCIIKQTRVGEVPKLLCCKTMAPVTTDYCGCKSKTARGFSGRALIGRPSVFSTSSAAQLEPPSVWYPSFQLFPQTFFLASPVWSRMFFQVDRVLVFCPAVNFIPGIRAAWDESAWNVSRDGSMDAIR